MRETESLPLLSWALLPAKMQPLSWASYSDGNTGLPLAFVREEFRPWNFINLRPRGVRKQKCNM